MSLADYERTFTRVSLGEQVDEADLRALGGDPERWRLYRRMVRTRLSSMAQVAFTRFAALLGESAFEACHDRFLASGGADSPFIREVVAGFGRFALSDPALPPSAYVRDLLRFELAKWELAYEPAQLPEVEREFDFDGVPVLHPVLRILELQFPVHRDASDDTQPEEPTGLFIYRPEGASGVRWWAPDAFGVALFRRFQAGARCVPDAVREAAEQVGEPLTAKLLERLSTTLALAVERGLLLGSNSDRAS